jgi:hypothetical protein
MIQLFKGTFHFGDKEVCRKVVKGTFEKLRAKVWAKS